MILPHGEFKARAPEKRLGGASAPTAQAGVCASHSTISSFAALDLAYALCAKLTH
jgi:hypothetical protein